MTLTDGCALAAAGWFVWCTWPRPRVRHLDLGSPSGERNRSLRPPHRRRDRRRDHRTSDRAGALAAWCADVARLVRSGESLAAAVAGVAVPDEPRLADAVASLGRGRAPDVGTPVDRDVALVLGVLAGLHEHGGAAAEPLDRAAAVLRSRAELLAEATTQSAQARWSAQVMTALPSTMLLVLVATSSSVRVAVVQPVGVALVVTGAALNLVGWWWLRSLLRRPTA